MNIIEKVYATDTVSTTVQAPTTAFGENTTIGDLAGYAINIILGIGWALTFIMLAAGFIKYILSKGETKATDSARQWLTYAALGGVGLFFITVIKSIILNLIGAEQTATPGGSNQFNPFQ